jgi:hypothetical protein
VDQQRAGPPPRDGSLVWAYQFTPHDNWDYDSNAEMILRDLTIRGRPRKVLVHFDKNGFAYTIDRTSGEVLVAEPFVSLNWARRIDLKTGRPVVDSSKLTGFSKGNRHLHLSQPRGRQEPGVSRQAYSPRTGLIYVLHRQPLHGLPRGRGVADREALRSSARARRTSRGPAATWGIHCVGCAAGRRSGRSRRNTGVERCGGHRRRAWSLRHARRLAQGGRRAHQGSCSGSSSRLRDSGRADHLPRCGRQTLPGGVRGIGGDWALLSGDVRSDDPADVRDPADFIKDHRPVHQPGRDGLDLRAG